MPVCNFSGGVVVWMSGVLVACEMGFGKRSSMLMRRDKRIILPLVILSVNEGSHALSNEILR